ncbi:O-acyltransferase like protein [Trichomycterus rosablanca]|uniref:O-acyltransferase like protein n=1 Tax=Trichomycterus rosablanca TaxID=2290929 RepID=UPI002F3518DE
MLQVGRITALSSVRLLLLWTVVRALNVTEKCARDASAFLSELERDSPQRYAVLMYDAFGKLGSDVEGGNMNQIGSLQECLSVKGPGFGGRYCQVFLKQGFLHYFVGICMPDSCSEEEVLLLVYDDFRHGGTSLIAPVPHLYSPDPTLELHNIQCMERDVRPDGSAIVCLCVCVLMMVLPLAATLCEPLVRRCKGRDAGSGVELANYGALLENSSANQSRACASLQDDTPVHEGRTTSQASAMLRGFSVRCSGVLSGDGGASGCRYPSLHGVRILSLFWIICGHTVQLSVWSGLDNVTRWREVVDMNALYVVAFSGPVYLAVDTFLLLGGILSSKSLLASIQRSEDKLSLRLIAHFLYRRFTRIQPLHLYMVCVIVALFSLVHDGTFWFVAEDEMMNCRKFWWSNLLLINNLFTITHTCAPWTWYLSVDFQFYATTPLLVFLYRLNNGVLVGVAVLLFLICGVSSALITEFLNLPVHQPTTLEYESYFQYYYNKPYTRYGPYLLGILTGIYMTTKTEALIKQKWQAAVGWLVSLSLMAATVGCAYLLRGQGSPGHAVYQGLHRLLWAFAVAWVILACEEGYGGLVNKFLSARAWVPLSNISFACYLVHPVLILLYNTRQETALHYTDLNFLYLFLGHSLLAVVLGFVLTVLVEKPYQFLSRIKG